VGRINGNLNLSRSLGDLKYKQLFHLKREEQIISAEPDITITDLEEGIGDYDRDNDDDGDDDGDEMEEREGGRIVVISMIDIIIKTTVVTVTERFHL
jgi:hypothetical protein